MITYHKSNRFFTILKDESGPLNSKEPGENATGLYRKYFKLPNSWNCDNKNDKNSRIFIIFEGVDSCANFYLNGTFLGFSKDSCLPCEFDITEIIKNSKEGEEHLLAVQVHDFPISFLFSFLL